MAGFDQQVSVNVSIGAPSVSQVGFGVPLFATDQIGAGFTEWLRFYSTVAAVNADSDLLQVAKDAAIAALSQTPRVDRVAIGAVPDMAFFSSTDLDNIRGESDDWYGLAIDSVLDADNTVAAQWAESNMKLFIGESADPDLLTAADGIAADLNALSLTRVAILYHDPASPDYPAMCWFSKKLSANPDTRSTNWPYVALAGVAVDDLTDSQVTFLLAEDANAYTTFKGNNVVGLGRLVNGTPIDRLIAQDWTTVRIQETTAQVLQDYSERNSKPPYTNAGIEIFVDVIRRHIRRGIAAGWFVQDTESITGPGGAGLKVSDQAQIDRDNRTIRLEFSVGLAGAIEGVAYTGSLVVGL